METVIKNHIEQLQTSATRMLLLESDNAMLISYFKDLQEKLIYLAELVNMESKYNWQELENNIESLKSQDENLTHIAIYLKIRDLEKQYTGLIKFEL
jgi:archaellum component FlaC